MLKDNITIPLSKGVKWEPNTIKIFTKYLNENTIYLDVGTFTGPTIILADSLGVKNIYGIEANPKTFDILKHNLSQNNISAHIFNLAVTDKDGEHISFGYNPIVKFLLGTSSSKIKAGNQFLVTTTKLISFMKKNNIFPPKKPNFIKIDIEGAEGFLIEDLKELSKYPMIIFLSVHIGDLFVPENITKKELLKQFIELHNSYNIYSSTEELLTKDLLTRKFNKEKLFEILLVSRNCN